jgi:hypothetical protein
MNHFGACTVFTLVTARTLRFLPKRRIFLECFRPFVASWPAPSASGRSESGRVGISPTGLVHLRQGTHNNAAERELRVVALGRKNYLFAGSDAGGERAAAFYSLIGTAKLCGLDPQAYLRHVLEHIAEHPINQVHTLLPWCVASQLTSHIQRAA